MPIYEFRCSSCGRVSSFLTRSISATLYPSCHHCQSRDLQRRMSTFSMGQASRSGLDSSAPDYYGDPRNIGRGVEDGFKQYGLDMPQSVRNTIDAAREGHLPREVE